jgi:hypothetical protein
MRFRDEYLLRKILAALTVIVGVIVSFSILVGVHGIIGAIIAASLACSCLLLTCLMTAVIQKLSNDNMVGVVSAIMLFMLFNAGLGIGAALSADPTGLLFSITIISIAVNGLIGPMALLMTTSKPADNSEKETISTLPSISSVSPHHAIQNTFAVNQNKVTARTSQPGQALAARHRFLSLVSSSQLMPTLPRSSLSIDLNAARVAMLKASLERKADGDTNDALNTSPLAGATERLLDDGDDESPTNKTVIRPKPR